jgi:hypothetical protein
MSNPIQCHAFKDDGTGQCEEYEYCISKLTSAKTTDNHYEKCGILELQDEDNNGNDGFEHKPEFWR